MAKYLRIHDLREDRDKTQQQLADELNMYKTTYARYEQGEREPPFAFMIQLAQYYGVSLDYLAGLTDSPEPPAAHKAPSRGGRGVVWCGGGGVKGFLTWIR